MSFKISKKGEDPFVYRCLESTLRKILLLLWLFDSIKEALYLFLFTVILNIMVLNQSNIFQSCILLILSYIFFVQHCRKKFIRTVML